MNKNRQKCDQPPDSQGLEKIAIKDVKMRTFITEDAGRNAAGSSVYDITPEGTISAA